MRFCFITFQDKFVDVRQYMDTSPYTVDVSASVQKCYRIFRTLGLRHLVVIDGAHTVKGIVTRKDITEEVLKDHESRVIQHSVHYVLERLILIIVSRLESRRTQRGAR